MHRRAVLRSLRATAEIECAHKSSDTPGVVDEIGHPGRCARRDSLCWSYLYRKPFFWGSDTNKFSELATAVLSLIMSARMYRPATSSYLE